VRHERAPARVAAILGKLCQNRTLGMLTLQGVFGAVPWKAFDFLTLYLQYAGFGDATAALVANCFMIGAAFGGVVGGAVSDKCRDCSPNHGRIFLVQAADLVRLPLVVAILQPGAASALTAAGAGAASVDAAGTSGVLLCVLLLLLGFFAPWVGVANKAIFAEATPRSARASAVSANAAIEGVFSALFGAPLVGHIAQHVYGYTVPAAGLSVAQLEPRLRQANAAALASSIYALSIWPWTVCLLLYTLVHWTFAHDRRVALAVDGEEVPSGCEE